MSRSFKHYPFCKDVNSSKWGKRVCNKRVRKNKEDMPKKGNIHKKMNPKWDFIYDYAFSETWEEYIEWCKSGRYGKEPEEPIYYEWYKWYKQK